MKNKLRRTQTQNNNNATEIINSRERYLRNLYIVKKVKEENQKLLFRLHYYKHLIINAISDDASLQIQINHKNFYKHVIIRVQ